jgi:hypothetical protein
MTTETPSPPASFPPRALPISRVFAWFQSALQLFKRAPWIWCALGAITLASRLTLELVPGIGRAAAEVIVPVIECGLLIGAAQLDRGAPLELRVAAAAFRAPPIALAAIVASSLAVSAVELGTAYELAEVNLLTDPDDARLTGSVLLAVIGIATLASLPFLFVPFAALFDRAGFVRAFAASLRGFALNTAPLLVFGALSLALTLIGLLTYGIGLIAVYPLLAAASYAAWKDVYAREADAFTAY